MDGRLLAQWGGRIQVSLHQGEVVCRWWAMRIRLRHAIETPYPRHQGYRNWVLVRQVQKRYFAPFVKLQVEQSIWQLSGVVCPPFDQGLMWSAFISLL